MARRAQRQRNSVSAAKRTKISNDTLYRATVDLSARETARDLEKFRIDFSCMPQPRRTLSQGGQLHFYATGAAIAAMRAAGRKIEVLADAQKEARKMQKHIGKGDRFKGGKTGPQGVGVVN